MYKRITKRAFNLNCGEGIEAISLWCFLNDLKECIRKLLCQLKKRGRNSTAPSLVYITIHFSILGYGVFDHGSQENEIFHWFHKCFAKVDWPESLIYKKSVERSGSFDLKSLNCGVSCLALHSPFTLLCTHWY